MTMGKLSKCLALGILSAGTMQLADALTPAQIQADITAGTLKVFYAAGGSAQANAIVVAANNLLTGNPIDIYTDTVVGGNCLNSNNIRFITGLWAADFTGAGGAKISAGTPVLIEYHFNKGSYPNGILPEATADPLITYTAPGGVPTPALTSPGFQNPNNLAQAAGGPPNGTGVACQAGSAYPNPTYSFTTTAAQQTTPAFGVSDVEISMFTFPFNYGAASGYPALTAGQVTNLAAAQGTYINVFGVVVSNAVFGGSSLGPAGCTKTSFTRQEITGIVTGAIADWSQLYCDGGVNAMGAGGITFLDRSLGSGTKAAENSYFLNYPAGIATGTFLTPYSIATGYSSGTAPNGNPCGNSQTTGGGANVLLDISEGSSQAIVNAMNGQPGNGEPVLPAGANTAAGGNCRMISVLGAEFPPSANGPGGVGQGLYSYVSLDGVPLDANINGAGGAGNNISYANEISGAYEFQVTNSFNYRTAAVKGGNPGACCNGLNGVVGPFVGDGSQASSFVSAMLAQMTSASFPGGVNKVKYPAGAPGTLVDPSINGVSPGTACVTLGTRFQLTPAPLQPFNTAATAGTSFACSEPH